MTEPEAIAVAMARGRAAARAHARAGARATAMGTQSHCKEMIYNEKAKGAQGFNWGAPCNNPLLKRRASPDIHSNKRGSCCSPS
jgi:hypothetical protein